MPFASKKQQRFLYTKHPELAEKWEREAKKAQRSKKRKVSFKRRRED